MTDITSVKIALFQRKEVRKIIYQGEWWFVIEDVISVLTDSNDPKQYIQRIKQRDDQLSTGWVQIVRTLDMPTKGGVQKVNCADTEGIFRIIQSIPSPKAEPFKRWLAKVGYERIQEIEDPELATKRTRALYKARGYSDEWIEKRMRGIAVREDLTGEWKKRGIKDIEYGILTAEISEATFGVKPNEHKKIKGLGRENLRDHMTDLELIFSILGDAATTEITKNKNANNFVEAKQAAKEGGTIAGNARRALEVKSGRRVVTSENYLSKPEDKKLLKRTNA